MKTMNPDTINRRTVCKNLFALGGISLSGSTLVRSQDETNLNEEKIAAAVKRGATMEEIANLRDPVATSPEEALRALKTGNARFFGGRAERPEMAAAERRSQILGQTPFAVILACSDSRVPTEIVFDQSFGNLFVTRIAGNVVDNGTTASIEYAITHLKTHLLVVMGHEGCGAVKAALLSEEDRAQESESIQTLLGQITPALENLPKIRDEKAKMREAVMANVRLQVANVKEQPAIKAAVEANRIKVVGAFYEISSGAVDFLETAEDLELSKVIPRDPRWRRHLA